MSQENVEAVRRAVEAWNADDLDAFLAELDADVEWQPAIESGLEGKATTAVSHGNASPIGLSSSATSASRCSHSVTWS
jgi:hypothetical protein